MRIVITLFAALAISGAAAAQDLSQLPGGLGQPSRLEGPIAAVEIHPVFTAYHSCTEHQAGENPTLGDDIGRDCTVEGYPPRADERRISSPYRTNGLVNEDYFGWTTQVLAPFDSVVEYVNEAETQNTPGVLGEGLPGLIVFLRADGMRVIYAHTREASVAAGDAVQAGQAVALVGNNGMSTGPHIHIAAWKEDAPYQIRFDLHALRDARAARRAQASD